MKNRTMENVMTNLAKAHMRKLVHENIWPTNNINLGWVVTESAFVSKTTKGILETKRLARGKYSHSWLERE